MARRTSFLSALAKAHARSVREHNANVRAHVAHERRLAQARAAAARADAAEIRAEEQRQKAAEAAAARSVRAHEREIRQTEKAEARITKENEQRAHQSAAEDAERRTIELNDTVESLQGILSHTLGVDDRIDFASLRITDQVPAFAAPPLRIPAYVASDAKAPPPPLPLMTRIDAEVRPMGFFERLFRSRRHAQDVERVTAAHAADVRAHEAAVVAYQTAVAAHRDNHARKVAQLRTEHEAAVARLATEHAAAVQAMEHKRAQRDAEVDELERSYGAGEPSSVELYNTMVLERSDYPAGFPQQFRIAYQPDSKQLVIDYELPTLEVVPTVAEYRYVKARKAVDEKDRKPAEIKSIYREVVAQTALRTLHEVFEADQGGHLDTVVFSGYVNRIDESTGQDVRPYLVSVRTTKQTFLGLNLARIEPQLCLKNLGAQVSPSPEECRAVKPIVDFNMVDPRFIGNTDVLSTLDARPNLMDLTPGEFEALVSNLFTSMGLDTKLTRASKDGGVDAVAYDQRPVLGGKVVIQAKRYRNTVGVSAVRDLYGTMLNEGASKGIIVTTSGYGPDAYTFANDKPLELIDGGGLLYLLEEIGKPARIIMPVDP